MKLSIININTTMNIVKGMLTYNIAKNIVVIVIKEDINCGKL